MFFDGNMTLKIKGCYSVWHALMGKVVLFKFKKGHSDSVILVKSVSATCIEGEVLALMAVQRSEQFTVQGGDLVVKSGMIEKPQVLTPEELPLLMGYDITTRLLTELLQGD